MAEGKTNPRVDEYLSKADRWQNEMQALRVILLDCGLTEDMKWGKPCYAFQEGNVALITPFKEYCALAFLKGALLKDTDSLLVSPGENSRATRQIRFTSVQEIVGLEAVLKAYIVEAAEIEKAGLKVDFRNSADLMIPEELQDKLDEIPGLKTAFEALTPGRQRAYVLYFSAPKQSKTREARIEKCVQRVLDGKGLDD